VRQRLGGRTGRNPGSPATRIDVDQNVEFYVPGARRMDQLSRVINMVNHGHRVRLPTRHLDES
jgi:hypothetical protein